MTYHLRGLNLPELPDEFMVGELLLVNGQPGAHDPQMFVYLGAAGELMRLGKVSFDKAQHRVETTEEITAHVNDRTKFSRMLGLMAVSC